MKLLIIGSGGREHALAWKCAQSPRATHIYVAPGNAGTQWPAADSHCAASTVKPADSSLGALLALAQELEIDLTIVGPEQPLADGIVDLFQAAGQKIFGPSAAAAKLEASKAFAKQFMANDAIPTADFGVFSTMEDAISYLDELERKDALREGVVVKASGLAAGKGVIVCDSRAEAEEAIKLIVEDQTFGKAGSRVLIEERLNGPELSLLAFSDGKTIKPLVPARDHKRAYDNDEGPNTGGMGAFAPVPDLSDEFMAEIMATIMRPTIAGMALREIPYVGVLYAGLMLTADGPQVLEFNCRFGDPETQVVLPLLQTDLIDIIEACLDQRLDQQTVDMHPNACAAVVMASPGYPGSYPKGLPISGLEAAAARSYTTVFHAGTATQDGHIVTAGGRVLAVSALGDTLDLALARAYEGVASINFDNAHFRRDIGQT